MLLLRRLYSFWCSLFSRQRSFCFLYCDITSKYVSLVSGLSGSPVVLDVELSVSAWYQKTRRTLLRARCLLLLLLLAADNRELESGGVRCAELSKFHAMERKQKNDFVPIRTRKNPTASKTHPHQKLSYLGHAQHATHRAPTHLPAGVEGEHMPRRPSCVCLPEYSFLRENATGALEA